MKSYRFTNALFAVGLLGGVAACASDEEAAPATALTAPDATDASVVAADPAPETVVTAPGSDATTVAPTTAAPATTSAPSTLAPSTTTTTTTTAPEPAPSDAVAAIDAANATIFGLSLRADLQSNEIVDTVTGQIGELTSDTGFIDTPDGEACYDSQRFRAVRWGDLRMTFSEVVIDGANEPTQLFTAWAIGDESAEQLAPKDAPPADVAPTGITTAEGIGVGSTRAELQAAYDGQALNSFDDDRVSIFFADSAAGAISFTFEGDNVTGIGNGPPDCASPDDDQR